MTGRLPEQEAGETGAATGLDALVASVRARSGVSLLTGDDLLILSAAEISRTYTFEERGYNPAPDRDKELNTP
jgi:hypothetical protein